MCILVRRPSMTNRKVWPRSRQSAILSPLLIVVSAIPYNIEAESREGPFMSQGEAESLTSYRAHQEPAIISRVSTLVSAMDTPSKAYLGFARQSLSRCSVAPFLVEPFSHILGTAKR